MFVWIAERCRDGRAREEDNVMGRRGRMASWRSDAFIGDVMKGENG